MEEVARKEDEGAREEDEGAREEVTAAAAAASWEEVGKRYS